MKKILLFTYLQRHLKKMIPIIGEFEKKEEISLTVLLMTQEEKAIATEHGISYKMLDEYTNQPRTLDFDLSWGLEPLINAIDSIQPDLFIGIEVNYILRNAIRHCKQKNIPNIIIQHGTPNKYSLQAFTPFEGDCFAAWGQFSKDFLISHGVQDSKIVLTGGIPFDRTISLQPDKGKIASVLNIDAGKKWIVFTTQGIGAGNCPSKEEIHIGVTEVAAYMKVQEDYQLIYQVHPGQSVEYIKEIVDAVEGHNAIVVKYKDTEELMAVSDGVITFFSTTAIDAILLDKPLMLINLTDDRDFYPFVRMGVAFGAYTTEGISIKLDDFLFKAEELKANYPKVKEYMNYRNDGKALRRVMKLIYNKLNL